MGFMHGFAMMCDSIAGTQGNINIHHVVGGDVLLMYGIGVVFMWWHPGVGVVVCGKGEEIEIESDRGRE